MSRDNRKDHRYFMFVASQVEEDALRTHKDEWLLKSFPNAQVQPTTLYPIRVDSVNASTVLDLTTGRVFPETSASISKENGNLLVGRIGWLNQPRKKYGSIVLFLKDKSQADAILARDFLEVGGESATTQAWKDRSKAEQRCFNCQKQGHLARACKEATICGNCALIGHHHKNCLTSTPQCPKCGGNYQAKDHNGNTALTTPNFHSTLAASSQPQVGISQPMFSPSGILHLLNPDKRLNESNGITIITANDVQDHSEMSNAW